MKLLAIRSGAEPSVTTSHVRVGGETLLGDQFSVQRRRLCSACADHGLKLTSSCGC